MKIKLILFCILLSILIIIGFRITKRPISQISIGNAKNTKTFIPLTPTPSIIIKYAPEPIRVFKSESASPIALPLLILESSSGTGWEGGTVPTPIPIPKTVTVRLPDQYKNTFSAVTIVEYNQLYPILLSPKGWIGSGGVGANGNASYSVHQKSDQEMDIPFVSYYEIPACTSCYFSAAAYLFPSVLKEAEKDPFWKPNPIFGLKTMDISSTIVSYSYPVTANGLEIYGIASIADKNNGEKVLFRSFEIGLPVGQRDTAIILLNYSYETNFLN